MINYRNCLVCLDVESLEETSIGRVTGRIWVECNGIAYPERQWNDFAVVVLAWWCEQLRHLADHEHDAVECRFMDGPFGLRISDKGKSWTVEGLGANGRGELLGDSLPIELMESVRVASNSLLRECRKHNWQGRDVEALAHQYRLLHETIAGYEH